MGGPDHDLRRPYPPPSLISDAALDLDGKIFVMLGLKSQNGNRWKFVRQAGSAVVEVVLMAGIC